MRWFPSCCCSTSLILGALALAPSLSGQQPSIIASAATLPDSPGFLQAASAERGSASISGLITDVNGGIVPGATISILDPAGTVTRQVTADADGAFRLDALPSGRYTLRIEAAGLKTFQAPPITLTDGQSYKLPDTALPIAPANQSVDVIVTREEIANEELKEETKQRVLGIMPNFYTSYVWDAAPLNARQKFKLSLRACTDPWVFIRTGITAGIQQANGTFPEYGSGGSGYAERYAASYGDVLTGRFIGSAVLPAIFHQDPRYFYRGTGGVSRRILHALVSSVAARTDQGHIEPNYTRTLGDFSAGYISRTWHPGGQKGISLALEDMLIGIGDAAGHNLVQEFLYKKISRGTPPFAKGKPPEEHQSAAHP